MKALNIFQINLFHIIYFIFKWKEKIAPPIFHSLLKPKAEIRTIFDQEENQQNHFIEKNVHSLTYTSNLSNFKSTHDLPMSLFFTR